MTPVAYVFWHRPRPGVDEDAYDAALLHFHGRLAGAGIAGLVASAAFRTDRAPWLGDGGPAYEDWYVVDTLAALEPLEAGAIAASMAGPHDAVAALAADGAGGVYRLRAGGPALEPRTAQWFDKPAGMSYAELDDALAVAAPAALWSRVMTLGPTPELCLVDAAPVASPFAPIPVVRNPVS